MDSPNELFLAGLHPSTRVLSQGVATVLGHTVDAVLVRNVYGQELVWGDFGTSRGKFKGHRSQSATTEGVRYVSTDGQVLECWNPPFGDY